jgi:Ca-activated chloride channel family protein
MAFQELPDPQIRVESALVTVPVIVTDSQARFLPGLQAGDFRLLQDGTPVPISLFLTSEDPVKIALLLDTSRSTTTVLDKIKKAADRFLQQMRPQDEATVVSFDSDVQMLCPLSSDTREVHRAINAAKAGGMGTRIRDAVWQIAGRRFRSLPGRKAIVLLTDGEDHGSEITAADLLDGLAASSTLIYSVFFHVDPQQLMKELIGVSARLPKAGRNAWQQREEQAIKFLEEVSDSAAGRFYKSDVKELDKSFKQISDELRAQYLIGFYPDQSKLDGQTHTLEVQVRVPDTVVRGRRSYRAVRRSDE